MESLSLRTADIAYHLERLSKSKTARKAFEKRDNALFRKACIKLHIPEKYVADIEKIVFSSQPDQSWPPVWA